MWFWNIEIGDAYNSYVSERNISLDGSWGLLNIY